MRLSATKLVALGIVTFTAPALVAGCRDMVAGDALVGVDELCAILGDCYGDQPDIPSCDAMKSQLLAADAAVTGDFLSALDPEKCFVTCSGALGCTDIAPLCDAEAGACVGRASCCGWTAGRADCVGNQCCKRDGQACDTGTCCNDNCRNGFCGGAACIEVGLECASAFDCCTRRCVDDDGDGTKLCALLGACAEIGEPCLSDGECCPSSGDGALPTCVLSAGNGQTGVCTAPEACADVATSCDPAGEGNCCDNLKCWPLLEGAICGDPICAPVDVDCEIDADCCDENVCQHSPQPHCEAAVDCDGNLDDPPCVKTGFPAAPGVDCCSCAQDEVTKICLESSAVPCGDLVVLACRSPCIEGERLSADSCDGNGTMAEDACVQAVILADAFCACTEWDSLCVARAKSTQACDVAVASCL